MKDQRRLFLFGPFEFDVEGRELRKHGMRVRMSASQIRLLSLFLDHPGELLTRQQIAEHVWSETGTIDIENGINTAINRLRGHLGDNSSQTRFIETVIGLGYRFIGPLESEEEDAAEPVSEDVPVAIEASEDRDAEAFESDLPHPAIVETHEFHPEPSRLLSPPRVWWLLGLIAAALALFAGWAHFKRERIRPEIATSFGDFTPVTRDHDENKATAAAVSPDGKLLAYADNFGISIHTFSSGTEYAVAQRPVFAVREIAWSSDQTSLVVSGYDETTHQSLIQVVSFFSAYAQLVIADADHAAISPSGDKIAFTRAGGTEVWLAGLLGSNTHRILTLEGHRTTKFLLWSLDGSHLSIETHAGNPTDPARPQDHQADGWSFDTFDVASGKLLHGESNVRLESAFLQADGQLIFLAKDERGLRLMSVLTDKMGRFLHGPRLEQNVAAWDADDLTGSRDGTRIAMVFQSRKPDVFTATLQREGAKPPALKDVRRLTYEAYDAYPHVWAANGDIYYESYPLPRLKRSILAQHEGERTARDVADPPENASLPQISPDGQWLLFMAGPNQDQRIYRIPLHGGAIEEVSVAGHPLEYHCPQAATASCVVREQIGSEALVYYALDPLHGRGKELARTPWEPNLLGDWDVSPDGSAVLSAIHDALHPSLRRVELNGTSHNIATILFHGAGEPLGVHWTSDGKGYFVESRTKDGYDLDYVDLARHATVLRSSPLLIWAIPSPDGKKIAFPSVTGDHNVWTSMRTRN